MVDTFKVLISFLQGMRPVALLALVWMMWTDDVCAGAVIGSLTAINILWPENLRHWLQWASGLNLEFTQLPSLACMMKDVSFLQRLIGYKLMYAIILLPAL